ncbi:MAG: transglutaminase-like domain-containing protein [Bacillota bacterium]|nr:transglutaminase-like domain-containing protein [Bacillota bacterium]
MILNKKLTNFITNFILTVLMSFCFVYTLTTSMNFKYKPYILIPVIFLITLFFSAITINKKVFKISIITITILLLGSIGILIYKFHISEIISNIEYFFNWLYDYLDSYKSQFIPEYGIMITAFFCFAITTLTFIFTVKKFNFILVLIGGSVLFSVQFINKYLITLSTLYLFLFLILVYYMKYIFIKNSSKASNEYVYPAVFTIYIIPLCAIILLLAFLIPTRSKPIEWKWLDTKMQTLYTSVFKGAMPSQFDYFSLSQTGFGNESGSLGGKITKNKTLVLKVSSPRSIYLKGAVKDVYTGSSWVNSDKSKFNITNDDNKGVLDYNSDLRKLNEKYFFDMNLYDKNNLFTNYLELLCGMSLLTNDNNMIKNYFTRDKVEVTFQNLSTKTLFLPANTYQLNAANESLLLNSNGDLTTVKRKSKNFKYTLNALNLTYNQKLEDLLRKSHKGLYDDYMNIYNNIVNTVGSKSAFVNQTVKDNNNPPIDLIDFNGFRAVVFALLKPARGNEQNTQNFFSDYGIDNFPQSVLNKLAQYNISVKNELFSHTVPTMISDKAISYIVPLDEVTSRNLSEFFTNKLNDISVTISPYSANLMNLLKNNSHEAYSKYLQLPNGIPERVKDLAYSITSTKDNQYDKVKAIESYLAKNYKYTLSPDNTPAGRDFVDYFLFDLKKGYCTYYSSAMVVMLRSIGIPARYVEGYIVTSASKKGNIYNITNEKSHAWVEVYFEGFGWLNFEPTSSYKETLDKEKSASIRPNERDKDIPSWVKNKRKPANTTNLQVTTLGEVSKKAKAWYFVIAAILLILLIFIAITLFNYMKSRRKLKRLIEMNPRECIISVYRNYLLYLSLSGYNKLDDETPKDFAKRLENLLISKQISLMTVTDSFVIARYSQNEVSAKDKAVALENLNKLIEYTKNRVGKFKYFIVKYLRGKI